MTLVEMSMTIKAEQLDDGNVIWQALASDTDEDRLGERTSAELFADWGARIEQNLTTPFLPWGPDMPFLSISHYPRLDGYGQAGKATELDITDKTVAGQGVFFDSQVGKEALSAIIAEQALVERGQFNGDPIRISAAWFDLAHRHDDILFARKSLTDKCPLCEAGIGGKVYMAGQLDHFALTRVPVNPRTAIGALKEQSMTKITRMQDAASIISAETAKELEDRQRAAMAGVGKSEAQDPVLVVKSEETVQSPNPFLMAYRSSTDGQQRQPVSFDEIEETDSTEGQLIALSDCVYKSHQIIGNIFGNAATGLDRPALIIKALEDALDRAYEIADIDLEERAMKGKGKNMPPWLKDKIEDDMDEEEEEEEEDEDKPMKGKSLATTGGQNMSALTERAGTLAGQIEQIAQGQGNRDQKYQVAQQAIEGFLAAVQQTIDEATPVAPVEQSQAVAGGDALAQALSQMSAQMVEVTKSLGLINEKLNRQPEYQFVPPQVPQVPAAQPVPRSLVPNAGLVNPMTQVERAQTQQTVGAPSQNGNSLHALIRGQYGLPPRS